MGDSNLPTPKIILADGAINFSPTDESSVQALKNLPPGKHTVIAEFEVPTAPADAPPVASEPLKITDSFLGQNLKLQGVTVSPPTPAVKASPHQQSIGYPTGSQPKSIFDFGKK